MKIKAIVISTLLVSPLMNQKTTAQELKAGPRHHKKLYINSNGEASTEPSIKELKNTVAHELNQYGLNTIKQFKQSSRFVKQSMNHLRQIIYKLSNHHLMLGSINEELDITPPSELNKQNVHNMIGKVYKNDDLEKVRVGTQELSDLVEESFKKLQKDIQPILEKIQEKWTPAYIKESYNLNDITKFSQNLNFDENSFEFKFHGKDNRIKQLSDSLNHLFSDYMTDIQKINELFEKESEKSTKDSIAFFQHELGLPISF